VTREAAATQRALAQLERRLEQAAAALEALNVRGRGKRRYRTQEAPAAWVEHILAQYEVEGVLEVTYVGQVEEKEVRGYGGHPSRVERREDWRTGEVKRREKAMAERQRLLGWRVYLTNGRAPRPSVDGCGRGQAVPGAMEGGTPLSAHETKY